MFQIVIFPLPFVPSHQRRGNMTFTEKLSPYADVEELKATRSI